MLPKSETEQLSDKIDKLGELIQEQKKLEQEILMLMQKNHFERHFGRVFQAEIKAVSQLQISDETKLVSLLEQVNLLQKVLAPTKTTLPRLLEDDTVPPHAKTKLRTLVQQIKEFHLRIEKSN